ncbi:hypothetical protein [Rhodohalobacter sulfatireducens]|uniref:Uncharacterized protein n=1 Tax=Rhodohalobacter sulfatireducens TaxID=2911366 RepID=A0ABS9KBE8_9BACT|nr:hypothetical protein [Rhodohalobacter sulfatireducens]MCG2588177.1 hypothetical protein [Rhodohalobacter sulfatireducens]
MVFPRSKSPNKKFKIIVAELDKLTLNKLNEKNFNGDVALISYIVEYNRAILELREFASTTKQNGKTKIIDLASNQENILRVLNGYPVEKISCENSQSNLTMYKEGCLDCGTAECYTTAKNACEGDPDCNFMCDTLDLAGGWCTLSIATSCFIYNVSLSLTEDNS